MGSLVQVLRYCQHLKGSLRPCCDCQVLFSQSLESCTSKLNPKHPQPPGASCLFFLAISGSVYMPCQLSQSGYDITPTGPSRLQLPPRLRRLSDSARVRLAAKAPAPAMILYTLNYQNHELCKLPVVSIHRAVKLNRNLRNNHGYGSQWKGGGRVGMPSSSGVRTLGEVFFLNRLLPLRLQLLWYGQPSPSHIQLRFVQVPSDFESAVSKIPAIRAS